MEVFTMIITLLGVATLTNGIMKVILWLDGEK